MNDFIDDFEALILKDEITGNDLFSLSVKLNNLVKENINDNDFKNDLTINLNKSRIISRFLKTKLDKFVDNILSDTISFDEFTKDTKDFADNILSAVKEQSMDKALNLYTREEERELSKDYLRNNILTVDFFEKQFKGFKTKPILKEAIGWVAGFIETKDYNHIDIIKMNKNGTIDERLTLKNLLTEINKRSITKKHPFDTSQHDNFRFYPAKKGELDVALWSEKDQKVIAMSVTCDPTTRIEQNQFFRHYCAALIISKKIEKERKIRNKDLTPLEVRNIVKAYKIPSSESVEKNIWDESVVFKNHLMELRRLFREEGILDVNKLENNIKKNEMNEILNSGKNLVKFYFYGEGCNYKLNHVNKEMAGYNSLAYTSNLQEFGFFKTNIDLSFNFMREAIETRYNNVIEGAESNFQVGLKNIINYITMTDEKEIKEKNTILSEGHVYKYERENFFKSLSTILKIVKLKIDTHVNGLTIEEKLTQFGINDLKLSEETSLLFAKTILKDNFKEELSNKILKIHTATSEVLFDRDRVIEIAENIESKTETIKIMEDPDTPQLVKEFLNSRINKKISTLKI